MSRLTRDGTAISVSRYQVLRRERGQGKKHFSCSADHEQGWQPYPVDVDPYSATCDDRASASVFLLPSISIPVAQLNTHEPPPSSNAIEHFDLPYEHGAFKRPYTLAGRVV